MSSTKDAEGVPHRLTGRTAIVTGASRGIGRAIAHALIDAGARVALIARSSAPLHELAHTLGPRALPVACDVSNDDAVSTAIAAVVNAFGGAPDLLVNNAGAFTLAPIETLDPSSFLTELETNLVAPLRFVRALLPGMRARGTGHIVTIGSVADRAIFPENAAYAASKHGARALHEVLRLETRGSGVRATLISPGPVNTPLWDPIDPDNREGFTPRAQMLEPQAVADAVLYAVMQPRDVNVDELRLSRS
jgi:NADP-dependent 3-hydroxy acid dehydrogenase YdfG